VKVKKRDYTAIEADVYLAKLQGIEEKVTEFGPAARFSFIVVEGNSAGATVSGLASIPSGGMGPKSKLRHFVEALLGRPLDDDDDEIDLDSLIGKTCRINVIQEQGKDGGTYNKITEVLAAPRPEKRQAETANTNF
jgi:hypothetical protein